ncbi:hypothetical protein [Flavobacterium humidisoli]|uniref:Uncharacterized protein n=1 Tax=Flavobacterium humidisoli TaxID=2937442 RepID=A0ABY4LL42_9FLAO|nr:hypothetical protein [Flavobacterium humidisoli]UPZ13823.1 hypothetical protein M0M44_13795 [Flavobacterium humidisoli]
MTKEFFVITNKSAYEKNTIKFNNLYEEKDLKKLDSVTKIKGKKLDSISFLIKLTRNELNKILKINYLGYNNEYKKFSNNMEKI